MEREGYDTEEISAEESSVEPSFDSEKSYNKKVSLYQKVFIGYLNWRKRFKQVLQKNKLPTTKP